MEENETKREILKDLLINEENTLQKLRTLVEKSKKHIGIDEKSGKIIFHSYSMANREKILLLLIGKYFAKELGILQKSTLSSKDISSQLDTKITTLSGPIGDLVRGGYIKKDGEEYGIQHYKIEEVLNGINSLKDGGNIKTRKIARRKSSNAKKYSTQEENKFSAVERGISELADKSKVEQEDNLRKIYDFGDDIHLLVHPEGTNEGEKQLKATILILTAYNHYFGQNKISSSKLRSMLQDVGIAGLVNLSTNLSKHRQLIIHEKGRRGNTNTYYKITLPGLHKGYSLIKEVLEHGD